MWLFVRIAISLCALGLLVYFIDFDAFLTTLQSIDLVLYASAILMLGLTPVVGAWRWRQTCRRTDTQLHYLAHLRICLIGLFLGQVLPTSVGVEAIRATLHSQESGSLTASATGVLADRISGLLALALLIVVCFPLQSLVIESAAGRALAASVSAACLVGLGLLLAAMLPIGARLAALAPFERVRQIAADLRRSFVDPASTGILVAISFLSYAVTLFALWLIAHSIGVPITPVQLLVLIPPAFLLMLVPLSIAGWGLRESGFVIFLGLAGVPGDAALAMSVLLGVAMIVVSLPGGVLFTKGRKKLPRPIQ